jgi:phage-related protein
MPQTTIRVFREANGTVPLEEWLKKLEEFEPRAHAKCLQRILLLSRLGNELRRPLADMLRDGIRELRAKKGRVNYRILYFFHGSHCVCLSHGFTKEGEIP